MKMKTARMLFSSSKTLFLIAFLSAVLGLVGCEKECAAEEAGKKIDQAAEKAGNKMDEAAQKAGDRMDEAKASLSEKAERTGDYMGDSAITAKIKADILRDPSLKVLQIHVTTTNGVVTLSGTVDSQLNIDRAVDLARGSQNVTSVENNLVLK